MSEEVIDLCDRDPSIRFQLRSPRPKHIDEVVWKVRGGKARPDAVRFDVDSDLAQVTDDELRIDARSSSRHEFLVRVDADDARPSSRKIGRLIADGASEVEDGEWRRGGSAA